MWEEYNISWTYIELERIRGLKQFLRSLTLSVQNQPESIRKFCLAAQLFYLALFELLRLNIRPFSSTVQRKILIIFSCWLENRVVPG
jgi:hypothetical protein